MQNRLKTTYQRNMLLGQLLSALIVLILYVALCLFNQGYREPVVIINRKNIVVLDPLKIDPPKKKGLNRPSNITEKNPPVCGHGIKIRTVELKNKIEIYDNSLPLETLEKPFIDSGIISFSVQEGKDQTFVIETDAAYPVIKVSNLAKSIEPKVIKKIDPTYPPVALDAGKEGEVAILIFIDSSGEISRFPYENAEGRVDFVKYLLIYEYPKGWFFADNLIKTLPGWHFAPAVENGKTICSYLKIKYTYCFGLDCSRTIISRQKILSN